MLEKIAIQAKSKFIVVRSKQCLSSEKVIVIDHHPSYLMSNRKCISTQLGAMSLKMGQQVD